MMSLFILKSNVNFFKWASDVSRLFHYFRSNEMSMGTWLGSDSKHSDRIRISSDTTLDRERISSQESTLREHADNLENSKRIVKVLSSVTKSTVSNHRIYCRILCGVQI